MACGVTVVGSGGGVSLEGVVGPVRVEADGPWVRVAWIANSARDDSRIRNAGGDVEVVFGSSGGCRVEAQSSEGGAGAGLPGVPVVEGGERAEGSVGEAVRPLVRVLARGDVRLSGGPRE